MIQGRQTRCIIAGVQHQLLGDIVQNIAEDSGGMEVVARIGCMEEVPAVVADQSADLLIVGMNNLSLPPLALSVMNLMPGLPIVGLVEDGRRLAVYLDRVGKNDFLRIVHLLGRAAREKSL